MTDAKNNASQISQKPDRPERRLATLRRNNAESNAFVRECIEGALIQLMAAKPFASITVTDIARRAGVSRNAYYRNYPSKEAILDGYLQSAIGVMSAVLRRFDPVAQTRESWIALLGEVRSFAPKYRLLLAAGYGPRIREEMRDHMSAGLGRGIPPSRYAADYWSGAICAVLEDWVRSGMDMPARELADLMADLMHRGVAAAADYGTECA